MNTTNDLTSSVQIATLVLQHTANILEQDFPGEYMYFSAGGRADLGNESAELLEEHLQHVSRSLRSLSDKAIIQWVRGTSSVRHRLPTWEMLLHAAYEEFVTRYNHDRASAFLVNLNVPRRDIMTKNTGNPEA